MNNQKIIIGLISLLFIFLSLFIYWQNNNLPQNINVKLPKNYNIVQEKDNKKNKIILEEEDEILDDEYIAFVDNYLVQFILFTFYCLAYGVLYNFCVNCFTFIGKKQKYDNFWEEVKESLFGRFLINIITFLVIVVLGGEVIISSVIYFLACLSNQKPLKHKKNI